ncbi:hypothetical protein [Halobacteriovorax sp. JY17]|uniref:hypothetical protein n=1 Tax=Halobacteriovorax sp. JY17 TaxID=2014617 RepID=UPI000C62C077|nr:hypothetical protein [Halobacteriovorax sp. JY17]PIK15481.1 MAG: hypothetical protein CES88_01815 [Halobacteriovorax sp. JY17]
MNNRAAKLILFFFLSANTFALPGMSTVSYDFTLNSEIFSKDAIYCQNKTKSDFGLQNISEFMGKMNCNRIEDPDKFCNCVSIISNNGIEISDEEAAKIEKVIDEESKKKIIESMAGGIEEFDGYEDMIAILGSQYENQKCFQEGPGGPIFGVMKKKLRTGEPLTLKEQLKKKILDKVTSDIKDAPEIGLNEVLNDTAKLKGLATVKGYNLKLHDNLNSDEPYDIGNINWSELNDSVITRLLRKDPMLPINLARSNKIEGVVAARDLRKAIHMNGLRNQRAGFGFLQNHHSARPFVSHVNSQFAESLGEELVNSAIRNACDDFKGKVDKMVESVDIEQSSRSVKAAMFNPVTEEQKNTFKIIEGALSKRLSAQRDDTTKKKMQEFIFNMDILYCKDRALARVAETDDSVKGEVSELKKFISNNAAEIELAKQERSEYYLKLQTAKESLSQYLELEDRTKKRASLFSDLESGKYIIKRDGKLFIDVNSQELLARAEGVDNTIFDMLLKHQREGSEYQVTAEQLVTSRVASERILKRIENMLPGIKKKFDEATFEHEEAMLKVSILEDTQKDYVAKLERKVGAGNALSIVANVEQEVGKSLGITSSYDMVVANERRMGRGNFSIKDAVNGAADDINISGNTAAVPSGPIGSTAIENEIETRPSEVSSAFEITDSSSLFANKIVNANSNLTGTGHINSINENRIEDKEKNNSESLEDRMSSREKELEKQLAELERLTSRSSSVDDSKPAESSIEKQISELKDQIKIEQIKAEKAKVAKEIKNLEQENSRTPAAVSSSNSQETSNPIQRAAVRNSRKSSSVARNSSSNSAAASSGNDFSSGSLGNSQSSASSSSAAPVSNSRELPASDGSNYEKSKAISLTSINSSGGVTTLSDGLEISSFSGELANTDTRLVKIDFNLSSVDSEKQEELLEALFIDGEEQIIIETLEGKKVIVKNNIDKNKDVKRNKGKQIKKDHKKTRHQNLIELLKIGQTGNSL